MSLKVSNEIEEIAPDLVIKELKKIDNIIYILTRETETSRVIKEYLAAHNIIHAVDFESITEDILENKVKMLIFEEEYLIALKKFHDEFLRKIEHINIVCILLTNKSIKEIKMKDLAHYSVIDVIEKPINKGHLSMATTNASNVYHLKHRLKKQIRINRRYLHTLKTLNEIGIALSSEKDLDSLLSTILTKIRQLTNSDSGSIYIVENLDTITIEERTKAMSTNGTINKNLIFKISQNDSVKIDFSEVKIPVNTKSLAGYVALYGQPLNIEDAYSIPENSEYRFYKEIDKDIGYKTKSMLILPMKNHKSEVTGVISLINRKKDFNIILKDLSTYFDRYVMPFDKEIEEFAMSVASQAAIAIENVQLLQNIRNLFDGFVKASIKAIEQRDPSTSGHSERVAQLSVALAEKLNTIDNGKYSKVHFSDEQLTEIRYAALLHDFGKVGVRERVLIKANKLYDYQIASLKERFGFLKEYIKNETLNKKVDFLKNNDDHDWRPFFKSLDATLRTQLQEIEDYFDFVLEKNKPSYIDDESKSKLKKISELELIDHEGEPRHFLTNDEVNDLCIGYGSLNQEERKEIESHVTHTYEFLTKIPWLPTLKNIPEIAWAHHEKLNGDGYPRGLKSEEIPLQSKILTVADIFDALTASDRPYKLAIPLEKALRILLLEVEADHIDKELVDIFINYKIYRILPNFKDK